MKRTILPALAATLLLATGSALAANDSPAGTWKTIDDATHQPKSIVEITEHDGKFEAKIVELLNRSPEDIERDGDPALCTKCEGDKHNQPVVGMTIMWDVSRNGDVWDGGRIMDPKNGKTYKVKLSLNEDGSQLDVHGYIGFSLLGRSQTWERQ